MISGSFAVRIVVTEEDCRKLEERCKSKQKPVKRITKEQKRELILKAIEKRL